jgi:hypothetical protein
VGLTAARVTKLAGTESASTLTGVKNENRPNVVKPAASGMRNVTTENVKNWVVLAVENTVLTRITVLTPTVKGSTILSRLTKRVTLKGILNGSSCLEEQITTIGSAAPREVPCAARKGILKAYVQSSDGWILQILS